MNNVSHLVTVTRTRFWEFVNNNLNLKKENGNIFHSKVWYNEKREIEAYMETSSWGAPDLYLIKEEEGGFTQNNFRTISVVNKLFNQKQK